MTASEPIHVFGVRHLSPGGAWHLRRFLDRVRPELVMIEGLADAVELTKDWGGPGTKPPIAILAYTADLPMRTLVYPIARYSPEYQAVLWAQEHRAEIGFIDLPSSIFLGLQDLELQRLEARPQRSASSDDSREASSASQTDSPPLTVEHADDDEAAAAASLIYDEIARRSGEPSYDTYWERNFEHNLNDEAYRLAAIQFGQSLRELQCEPRPRLAKSLVREAFMRRCIQQAIARGYRPDKIVAVVGAFHASELNGDKPPLTDEELALLPRRESRLALMPYSYFRLSTQSGYGAGNSAPGYFELMWDALADDALPSLPERYLSRVARQMRSRGTHRSTAEVIEGARLARTLSALCGGTAPTLADLRDAAVSVLGHGELANIAEDLAHVDVGTAIGSLPSGASRTSIQDDFERELVRLKLDKYRTVVVQTLRLDLRENRQAKSEAAAFLDLHRSIFLHRLRILGIEFAKLLPSYQAGATWGEFWNVRWSPESEITLVESVLLGETVELAASCRLQQEIEQVASIDDAARLVNDAFRCALPTMMADARQRLQTLATGSTSLPAIARSAFELMQVVRYGDVRRFDTTPLVPLIEELFVQGALALPDAANCDDAAARDLAVAMDQLNRIALEFSEWLDESLWRRQLQSLSDADDRNPLLSGIACALLLERGWMENETLGREVSRRLSPGVPADLGAGWFAGLASRNRYGLIARQVLWDHLAAYVRTLDDDEFRRALVFLRRTFGSFSPAEKRGIAENLAHTWGILAAPASEILESRLNAHEEQALTELNEFDFE